MFSGFRLFCNGFHTGFHWLSRLSCISVYKALIVLWVQSIGVRAIGVIIVIVRKRRVTQTSNRVCVCVCESVCVCVCARAYARKSSACRCTCVIVHVASDVSRISALFTRAHAYVYLWHRMLSLQCNT